MRGRYFSPVEVYELEQHQNPRNVSKLSHGRATGSIQWLFQAVSGAFIIFFLGLHLYVAHINGGSPVELFETVIVNLRNPWWLAFFLAFVWIVTYHAINGIKGIIYETGISRGARRIVSYLLSALFIVSVIYGTILALIVASMPLP